MHIACARAGLVHNSYLRLPHAFGILNVDDYPMIFDGHIVCRVGNDCKNLHMSAVHVKT